MTPCAPVAGEKVSVPLPATAGWPPAVNSEVSLLETAKETTCATSSDGPGVIAVAHAATVCGAAFSSTA